MHKLIRLSLLLGLFFSSFSIWLAINEYLRFNIIFVVVAFLISCTQLNNGLIKRQNNTQIESISIIIFLLFVFISFVINFFINPQPKLISNTIATFAIVFLLYFFYSSVVDTYLSLNDCLRWLAYGGVFFLLLLTVDCLLLNIVGLNIGEWFVFGIEPNAYFFVRQDWYSVAGSTGEPANAALTLLILFPFVLLYFNRTILQISFIILFIFNLVALMSTTGFVSFALVLFIFLFLDIPYKIKIVYVFGLICFIFVILYNIEYVIDYFNTIGLLEKVSMSGNTSSDASRMESYMMAIDDFVDSPLFGKGAGFGKYIKGEGYLSLLLGNYGMYGFLGATSFIVFFGCILKKVFAITGKMKLAFVAAFIPLTISACVSDMLHYCWLGNNQIPPNQVECMNSWQKYCPNVKIIRWDYTNFDIQSVPLVKEAVEANKLAFAADYIRQYALYYEGGVYLDTDVMLYDDIFNYLDADYVSAVEYHPKKSDIESNIGFLDNKGIRASDRIKVYGIGILSAILASVPKHPLVKKCMDFYEQKSLNDILINHLTAPTVIAYNAEEYGFKYKNAEQRLENSIHLYTPQVFSHFDQYNKHSVAVHYCAGSWVKKGFLRKCLDFVKSNKLTFSVYTFLKRKKII